MCAAMATHNNYALHQFCTKLKEFTVHPTCDGSSYIRTSRLIEWMTAHVPGQRGTNTEHLLQRAYESHWPLPITHSKICSSGVDRCILVFCILLEIGLGHMIHEMQKKDIVDHYLPMSLGDLKGKFQSISTLDRTTAIKYAEYFDQAQWKFRPLTFRWDMDKECPEQRILPICRKQEIGRGGQARVFSIAVQADYVTPELRDYLSQDEHTRFLDEVYGDCFQFALKTFEEGNIAYFNDEKRAFDALRSNKGMIRYLGSFGHKETRRVERNTGGFGQKTTITKHILLEYGRFDLMKIFMYRLPPVISSEIRNFWVALIEIVDALKGIHKIKTKNGDYNGWHNDIKPGNIIAVNGSYKLADPGFAKFQKRLETDKDPFPTIVAGGGTRTYSAPECYARVRNSQVEVTQSVDIWSVGCVLSMAATWVVLGFQGIYQFRIIRQRAIEELNRTSPMDGSQHAMDPGDFFHNGTHILSEVKQWHRYLRAVARQTDRTTQKILDFVEENMLVPAKARLSAEKLYDGLHDLLKNNEEEEEAIPIELQHVLGLLLDIDEDAPSTPQDVLAQVYSAEPTAMHKSRPRAKIDNLDVPQLLKTASRFESLSKMSGSRSPKLDLASPSQLKDGNDHFYKGNVSQPRQSQRNPASDPRASIISMQLPNSRSATFYSQRVQDPTSPPPQNVIQAREEFRDSAWYKKPTDEVLKAHFDNRDIIFLIDNASSMEPYWDEATYLLETLVMKAKPFDKNGMDLRFTLSPKSLDNEKSESAFRKKMRETRPTKVQMTTDMTIAIERIFHSYFQEIDNLKKSKKPKEDLTLIILTDGIWAAESSDDVYNYIQKLLKELEKRDILGYKKRPVSIEFVQFGDNDDATERLRALDDDMEFRGYKDIIDHEMFSINGDVRKMLLGSFVPMMDKLDNHELSPSRDGTSVSYGSVGRNRSSAVITALQNIPEVSQDRLPPNSTTSSVYQTPSDGERPFYANLPR